MTTRNNAFQPYEVFIIHVALRDTKFKFHWTVVKMDRGIGSMTHIGKRRLFLALNNSSRPNDNLE